MRLTVAICTWNRAASLERTLATLDAAIRPQAELEVLVVNNRCTDDTDAVIANYASRLPLRRVWQPEPGLSNARNAAVDATTGDYILWTDDDVLIEPGWLVAYERAIRANPGAAFFGGPIEPVFEGGKPGWIEDNWPLLKYAFAERELGAEPFQFDRRCLPFGANMVVRSPEQRSYRFNARLGRQPGAALLGGDELEMLRTLLASGGHGWWVPGARVKHVISRERQTLEYFRAYFTGQGLTDALTNPCVSGRTLFGIPLWPWRNAVQQSTRYRVLRVTGRRKLWLPAFIQAAHARGYLMGHGRNSTPQ